MTAEMRIRLVIPSHTSTELAEWLGPLRVAERPDGCAELTGVLPDQTALHALCNRVRDLGLGLESLLVERVER